MTSVVPVELADLWVHVTTSLVVQIFLFSTVALACGIALIVWMRVVHLSFLDPVPLNLIEAEHPHVQSLKVILTIFICSIVLLVVALQTLAGTPPFDGPYESLYLAAIFVLGGASSILLELKWKGAREYVFAFIIGTAIAYLFLVFQFSIPLLSHVRIWSTFAVLIAATLLAWKTLFLSWHKKVQVVSMLTFLGWLLFYTFA